MHDVLAELTPADLRRQTGLRLTDVSRLAGVKYTRLWAASLGGPPLAPEELDRIRRVLDEALASRKAS